MSQWLFTGDLGQCWGQSIDITIEKDGYFVSFNNVSEVIAREEKKGRKLISKEKAIRACLDNYFGIKMRRMKRAY